jgi:signal transduction histidine kinase
MKILLAEDNPFYRRMLERMLQDWGYTVLNASCGEEAWQLLQQADPPRLALLDWLMPGLDGLELCRRIRADRAIQSTYVVMITAKQGRESTLEAFSSGADDFITKPFDREELQARLRVGARLVEMQDRLASTIVQLEAALSGAQKMEAIGRLAGGVAHDFNNLLTIITGASDLLTAHPRCDSQQRELIHMIKGASDRGAALTRQLLAFSRKQLLRPVVLDLNTLIVQLEKMLCRLIGEDIELITKLAANVGLIKADAGQVEQVIINLLVNARDAMPLGGKIWIRTENAVTPSAVHGLGATSAGPAYTRLIVQDTGCGMDRDTLAHIFEPFFTTKEVGKGTGLGLATVYGIIKQSEGFIEVESEPNVGTTFSIYLPQTTESIECPGERLCPLPNDPSSATILLAEDEQDVRRMVRKVLETYGYAVLEAANGKDALHLSCQYPRAIQLLLTDTIMPSMGGPELADKIRQFRPEMKVLFVSGYTDDSLLKRKVLASGQPFLQKPFSPQTLLHKVQEVLNLSGSRC